MTVLRGSASPSLGRAVDTATDAIMAWRAWSLTGDRDGERLLLRPVAGRSRPWRPREVAEAACKGARFHQAPHPDCTCGLHGTRGLDVLRRTKSPAVLGRVALWGRVIEHEHGYRAQFAYPQRLKLICQFCFWLWGVLAPFPDHVGWFPRDELIPICGPHLEMARRYGLEPRALLSASTIDQRLRNTYAVDALAL